MVGSRYLVLGVEVEVLHAVEHSRTTTTSTRCPGGSIHPDSLFQDDAHEYQLVVLPASPSCSTRSTSTRSKIQDDKYSARSSRKYFRRPPRRARCPPCVPRGRSSRRSAPFGIVLSSDVNRARKRKRNTLDPFGSDSLEREYHADA